mgnify:CR=1 FL=1
MIFLLFSCRSSGFASDFLLVIYLARFLINDFSVLTYGVAGKTATTKMLLKVNLRVYEFNGDPTITSL